MIHVKQIDANYSEIPTGNVPGTLGTFIKKYNLVKVDESPIIEGDYSNGVDTFFITKSISTYLLTDEGAEYLDGMSGERVTIDQIEAEMNPLHTLTERFARMIVVCPATETEPEREIVVAD